MRNLGYNQRREGRLKRPPRLGASRCLALCLLGLTLFPLTPPALAEIVRIPTLQEYDGWGLPQRQRFAASLEIEGMNVRALIAGGVLRPGQVYDLAHPLNNFIFKMRRWQKHFEAGRSDGIVDYKEVMLWNKTRKAFRRLDKWVERERKQKPGLR